MEATESFYHMLVSIRPEVIIDLLTPVTILLSVWKYSRIAKKERQEREDKTYSSLDETYKDFLLLCFNNPQLDIYDVPDDNFAELTNEQKKQEMIALTMLISLFEKAYLMYRGQRTSFRNKQWTGWEEYMVDYCHRGNFKRAWEKNGDTYDSEFVRYMNKLFKKAK